MPDLAALNAAERQTLALLAQGHTAKSIAALTGRSVASVNERLREARRKTGMGSSRELARLLAAQENRDEQIGMAGVTAAAAPLAPEAAPRRAGGLILGGSIMAVATIAAVLMLMPAAQEVPASDPLLGTFAQSEAQSAPRLYQRLRAEVRDPAWAPQAEAALRARFAAVPGVAPDRLRVICGATLCEIAGVLETRDAAAMDATLATLQDKPLREDMRRLGFTGDGPMGFGGEAGSAPRSRFYAYWTRKR